MAGERLTMNILTKKTTTTYKQKKSATVHLVQYMSASWQAIRVLNQQNKIAYLKKKILTLNIKLMQNVYQLYIGYINHAIFKPVNLRKYNNNKPTL